MTTSTTNSDTTTSLITYGEARQHSFRARVLRSRLAHIEAEADGLLLDISLMNKLDLPEVADRLEERLTHLTHEALRHRRALETRQPLAEILAPRMGQAAWAC